MYPRDYALSQPQHAACIMASTGETVTYKELEDRANQGAHLFRALGLQRGDAVAVLLENTARYFEIVWAAQRSGLYFTCISASLTADEVGYILDDCGASCLITSPSMHEVARQLVDTREHVSKFSVGGELDGYSSFETARSEHPISPIEDESVGIDMLYSSGTTGRPKGIRRQLPPASLPVDDVNPATAGASLMFGLSERTVYLSPAPLYHAAPLFTTMSAQRYGGTVIVMERFDPEFALELIQKYRVTSSQWVPTHFVRMLKLPEDTRTKYDVSSLEVAVHAAAPCPVPVKEAMLDWWGDVIYEYYSGTEGVGTTYITPAEWRTHKGSVGRAIPPCTISICTEDGETLPPNSDGLIYFHGGAPLNYHNDPEKTAKAYNAAGGATLGDIGRLDEEGYLYLTDRRDFTVISGGVNIYPQEIEDALIVHPQVADVAVFGVPCTEMGEKLVAAVIPAASEPADDRLREDLSAFAREKISAIKVPRIIEFVDELPRMPTGKLQKKLLREAYLDSLS